MKIQKNSFNDLSIHWKNVENKNVAKLKCRRKFLHSLKLEKLKIDTSLSRALVSNTEIISFSFSLSYSYVVFQHFYLLTFFPFHVFVVWHFYFSTTFKFTDLSSFSSSLFWSFIYTTTINRDFNSGKTTFLVQLFTSSLWFNVYFACITTHRYDKI